MDWVDPVSSEPIEEREDDMSSLAAGFTAQIHKRAASAHREITSGSKGPGGKCLKWYSLYEKAQKSPTVITMDSPERAIDALLALEGVAQDASKEAYASLEDGAPAGGPPNVD